MEFEKLNKEKIDFPSTLAYPREIIKRVQNELLDITKIVCGILEKNEIPYFIAYGTLFGAMKFEGFLPWDDDVDLFLFDDSYDRAIKVLEKDLSNHLIVHSKKNDPLYFLAWNSVKDLNVDVKDNGIYNADNRLLKYRCLGLDLYRLKKVKRTDVNQYKYKEAIEFFVRKLRAGIINRDEFNMRLKELYSYNYAIDESSEKLTNDNEVFTFVVKLNKPIEQHDIFPLKKYVFEDTALFGPSSPKRVLECTFSNIYELPNYIERKPHLKGVKFKSQ
jgi:lipopolysaccharide cholinephosphotransferase